MRFVYFNEYGDMTSMLPPPFDNVDCGERDKFSHPYSYDPITSHLRGGPADIGQSGAYTDRMMQQNYERFRALQKEHLGPRAGDYWNDFTIDQIEAFMCAWLDRSVNVVRVIEYCNQATGFPLWYITYDEVK